MALNIKYGVSTWLWTSPFTTQSIRELFPKISTMGFDVVEIAPRKGDILSEYNMAKLVYRLIGFLTVKEN